MSHKSGKIAELIAAHRGQGWDAHYLGYFECFNQGLFYEAHDVLEELWLPCRKGRNDLFYKGLIQLTGAFVHFQKDRLRPAGALLRLARTNLRQYPDQYEGIDLTVVMGLIDCWLERLESDGNPLKTHASPQLAFPAGAA